MTAFFLSNESLLVNLPGYVCWRDCDSRFIAANLNIIRELMGFNELSEIVGISDADMRCSAAACAEEFQRQDQKIMLTNQAMTTLNIHPYGQTLKTLISKKEPFYNTDGTIQGVFTNMIEIQGKTLVDLYLKVSKLDKYFLNPHGNGELVRQIAKKFDFADLTERESEVLYFLVRGRTARDISSILKIATRTVEAHINNIKSKIGLSKKSEIIMYCIDQGFLHTVPKGVLSHLVNLSIEI